MMRLHTTINKVLNPMKCIISWDVTPCSPAEVLRYLRGKYCLYILDDSNRKNQAGSRVCTTSCYCVFDLIFDSENGDSKFHGNVGELYRATRHQIPNYNTPHIHSCVKFKQVLILLFQGIQ
jgi:hypothetical protein